MFDPYHKWLGIPAKDQPPNHYRLLGIELFESDLEAIEGAVDRQMGFIRQYQSGPNGADASRILNELALARRCLLRPETKLAYDAQLRRDMVPAEADVPDLPPANIPRATKQISGKRKQKQRQSDAGIPQPMLIGGGIAIVVVALLTMFLFSGRPRPNPDKSNPPTSAAATDAPGTGETPPAVADKTPPSPISVEWSDPKLGADPAGESTDLLKLVDLTRDVVAGEWQRTETALIGGSHSRMYLPVKTPEDYQLKYRVRRLEAPETLVLGFMMSGRQGIVAVDGWNGTASGLFVDGLEPTDNCTTFKGALFTAGSAAIVLTVHPGHLHVSFDGRTIVDWHGDPTRLYLPSSFGVASRELPIVGVSGTKYVIEAASLVPLKPEPAVPRPSRLDRDVEILPLVDLDRDVQRGVWGVNKGTLYSPEGWGKLHLPVVVPEEYTLSGYVELPTESRGDPTFAIGFVTGQSHGLIYVRNNEGLGIDLVDVRRWNGNETRTTGSRLKPGVPAKFACTVTKSGIRLQLDDRTLIDWRGDPDSLSIRGDWVTSDARRLYLASQAHFKFRDLKLGPPRSAPALPDRPKLSPGREFDLMTIIDPARDSLNGVWEKEGGTLRNTDTGDLGKLVVPFEPPEEYKLTMRVARTTAGRDGELLVSLPFAKSQADIVMDANAGAVSGFYLDFRNFSDNAAAYRGTVIPSESSVDLTFIVRRTGLKVLRGEETLIDWTGNPRRMSWNSDHTVPGPRIAIGTWKHRLRFEKLAIEPLEPSGAEKARPLPSDGQLLSIVDVVRDARIGEWTLDGGVLNCPATPPARLNLPVAAPARYVLSAKVERRQGNRQLVLGLIVDGHPCTIAIDADLQHQAGIDLLDGNRYMNPVNFTHRNYGPPLLPQNQRVQVRCVVLPDTILVTCGDKEVIRWHGDPRRLTALSEVFPPGNSNADRAALWLGSWESGFAISDLVLKPLSESEAEKISKSFSGVFPTTPQRDVPFVTTPPELETTSTGSQKSLIEDVAELPVKSAFAGDEGAWRKLFSDRQFARLESIADELRRTNPKYRDGRSRLWRFYACLGEFPNGGGNEEDYRNQRELLAAWIKEIPQTIAGRIILSQSWYQYAFFARGKGLATETDEANLQKFSERCQRSSELLDEVEKMSPVRDIGYYRLRIDQCKGIGKKPERELVYDMLKIDPLNREAVSSMTFSLMPRWFGEPGELEDFADDIVRRTKNSSAGEFQYAIVGDMVEQYEDNFSFSAHHLDWPRLKRGYADFERHFPKSREHLDSYARLAIFANDFDAARPLMTRIGNAPNPQIWDQRTFTIWKEHLSPELHQGNHRKLIVAHYNTVTMLELLGDGEGIVSFDDWPSLRIHDLTTGKPLAANPMMNVNPWSVSTHGKSSTLAIGLTRNPGIRLLRLSDGKDGAIPHDKPVTLTRFTPDGRRLAFTDDGGSISLFDMKTGKVVRTVAPDKPLPVRSLQFSADGLLLAAVSDAGVVRVVAAHEDQDLRDWNIGKSNLRTAAWSPQGDVLAIGDADGRVTLFQWPDRKNIKTWQAAGNSVEALQFSPDGSQVAIGLCVADSAARVADPLRLWQVSGNDPPTLLQGHKMGVRKVRFNADGSQLVSAGDDWTIRTWDLKTRRPNQ